MSELEQAEARMTEYQELYLECRRQNAGLERSIRALKQAEKKMRELGAYYFGDWLEDYKLVSDQSTKRFLIANEDSIYNEIVRQETAVKKLLKACADLLNKGY